MNVGIGRQNIISCFWNKEGAQFHFWEYINGNQTFILDSHRPFICLYGTFSRVTRFSRKFSFQPYYFTCLLRLVTAALGSSLKICLLKISMFSVLAWRSRSSRVVTNTSSASCVIGINQSQLRTHYFQPMIVQDTKASTNESLSRPRCIRNQAIPEQRSFNSLPTIKKFQRIIGRINKWSLFWKFEKLHASSKVFVPDTFLF